MITRSPNRVWMMDNVDISQVIDFLAAMIVTGNVDCCHKNYYVYRDTEGDKEWEMFPWDVDLSFGRNWSGSESYWDDRVYPQNGLYVGGNATLPSQLFASSSLTRQMYLRRVRTLMDNLQQTNGTPASQLRYEKRIDELAAQLAPDAAMDLVKWGTWGGGSQNIFDVNSPYWRTLPQSVSELKTNYMPARRRYVFDQKMGGDLPNAQPANVTVQIRAVDYNPVSHNQEEEYIQLTNANNFAVDMSGWKLSGGITHTFQGGVVLGATSSVYVAANKVAFRARTTSPHGGQALYVEGPYDGRLSARGETIILTDTTGRVVSTNSYAGNPSGPQQYLRITEIMYHPPRLPSGTAYDAEDFEYIELRNTGPTNLNLAGVHFSNGLDFTFPDIVLTPGGYVLVVRNTAAFISRYGNGHNIAGQYVGTLDNGGETIRLDDAVGEKILEFKYNNSWYPITDGPGASLVILNDTADWRTWDQKESWRPSAVDLGSPGQTDGTPTLVLPVYVNEVLTRSDAPLV
ncbi:MAG TPA: lamin tail domain-containing protein, partial [Candidatus Dormibacteraeota bacterium]|nr:lamin tail domain-containing protein [Candidatus Dormibacteraeota bacterium]